MTSINRMSGLASGMDVDGMVTKLMTAARIPVDKMLQKKQVMQWQRDDYRDMNTKITDYRNNKVSNYRLESSYSMKKVDITGSPDAITAKALGDAENGSLTVEVKTLATAATNQSVSSITTGTGFDASKALGTQTANLSGTLGKTGDKYNQLSFSVNGTTVKVDPNVDSMNDIVKRINTNTNVSAFFDSTSGKISFIAKDTGNTNGVKKDQSNIDFQDLSGGNFVNGILKVTGTGTAATQADVTINGLSTKRDSNTFTVNGVQLTLNKPTTVGSPAQLAISSDTDKIVETVKNFITDYNSMLKTVQDKVNEQKYSDYPPLTDDQKKDMKDSDITLWNQKAKSGLLGKDSTLNNLIDKMRFDIVQPVNTGDPKINSLASIGVGSYSYADNGKLYITDETKLRDAITSNPDAVMKLFTSKDSSSTSTTSGTSASSSNNGIAQRLYSDLKSTMDSITQKAGYPSIYDSSTRDSSTLGQQLYSLGKEIDDKNDQLQSLETRYYTQFSAMESAMEKYNQQSAYLTNQFSK